MGDPNGPNDVDIPDAPKWDISVFSNLVKPKGKGQRSRMGRSELEAAHWCVMEHCTEAEKYIELPQK